MQRAAYYLGCCGPLSSVGMGGLKLELFGGSKRVSVWDRYSFPEVLESRGAKSRQPPRLALA